MFNLYSAATGRTAPNRVTSTSVMYQPNNWQNNWDREQVILDILLRYEGVIHGFIQTCRDCKGISWKQLEVGDMWSETRTSYRNWHRYCGTGRQHARWNPNLMFREHRTFFLDLTGLSRNCTFEMLERSPHRLDVAPSVCQAFDPLQYALRGRHFTSD